MNLTGRTEFIQGRKLYEREDTFWQDDTGRKFDIRNGELYREDAPGEWSWLRPAPQPRDVSSDRAEDFNSW